MDAAGDSLLPRTCPNCGGNSIARTRFLAIRKPLFRCPDCDTDLKTAFGPSTLWRIPVGLALIAVTFLFLLWLRDSLIVDGRLYALIALVCMLLATSVSVRVAFRGLV